MKAPIIMYQTSRKICSFNADLSTPSVGQTITSGSPCSMTERYKKDFEYSVYDCLSNCARIDSDQSNQSLSFRILFVHCQEMLP